MPGGMTAPTALPGTMPHCTHAVLTALHAWWHDCITLFGGLTAPNACCADWLHSMPGGMTAPTPAVLTAVHAAWQDCTPLPGGLFALHANSPTCNIVRMQMAIGMFQKGQWLLLYGKLPDKTALLRHDAALALRAGIIKMQPSRRRG
jgi:hypothetical protein